MKNMKYMLIRNLIVALNIMNDMFGYDDCNLEIYRLSLSE